MKKLFLMKSSGFSENLLKARKIVTFVAISLFTFVSSFSFSGKDVNALATGLHSAAVISSDGTPSFTTSGGLSGNDDGANNNIVRSYDDVVYQVDFGYSSPTQESANIIIEAKAPASNGSEAEYIWDVKALEELGYDFEAVESDNTIIRVKYNDVVSGHGKSSKLVLKVLGVANGTVFHPEFNVYEEGKSVEANNVLIPADITVSAKPAFNFSTPSTIPLYQQSVSLDPDGNGTSETYNLYLMPIELQMKIPGGFKGTENTAGPLTITENIKASFQEIDGSTLGDLGSPVNMDQVYLYDYGLINGPGMFNSGNTLNTTAPAGLIAGKEEYAGSGNYVYNSGDVSLKVNGITATQNMKMIPAADGAGGNIEMTFANYEHNVSNLTTTGRGNETISFATAGVVIAVRADNSPKPSAGAYDIDLNTEFTGNTGISVSGQTLVGLDLTGDNSSTITHSVRVPGGEVLNNWVAGPSVVITEGSSNQGTATVPIGNHVHNASDVYGLRSNYEGGAEYTHVYDPRAFEPIPYERDWGIYSYYPSGNNTAYYDKSDYTVYYGVRTFTTASMEDGSIENTLKKLTGVTPLPGDNLIVPGTIEYDAGSTGGWTWYDNLDDAKAAEISYEDAKAAGTNAVQICATKYDLRTNVKGSINHIQLFSRADLLIEDNQFTRADKDAKADGTQVHEGFMSVSHARLFTTQTKSQLLQNGATSADYKDFGTLVYADYQKTVFDVSGAKVSGHLPSNAGQGQTWSIADYQVQISKYALDKDGNIVNTYPLSLSVETNDHVDWVINPSTVGADLPVPGNGEITVTDVIPAGLTLDRSSVSPTPDSIIKNTDGSTTLVFKYNKNISEPLEQIKYRTTFNKFDAISINSFTNTASIEAGGKTAVTSRQIQFVSNSSIELDKSVDKPLIAPNGSFSYTLNYRNNGADKTDVELYDVFPYTDDYRGNNFSGELNLASVSGLPAGATIYYTYDAGLTNNDVDEADFKTESEWASEFDISKVTGIKVVMPTLASGEVNAIKLDFNTSENVNFDEYYNDFGVRYFLDGVEIPLMSNPVKTVVGDLVHKTVDFTEDAKEQAISAGKDEVFHFNVGFYIPDDNLTSASLTDELESELEYISAKVLDKDGNDITASLGTLSFDDVTNTLSYVFNDTSLPIIPGNYYKVVITAKFKEDADLTKYVNSTVPNQADFEYNGTHNPSNTVEVKPIIEKRVDKVEDAEEYWLLTDRETDYYYNIGINIPDQPIVAASITDELEPVLEYVSAKLLDVDGNDVTNDLGAVTYDSITNTVNYVFSASSYATIQNNYYRLVIVAQIKEGADLSVYPNEQVPNDAIFDYNGKGYVSNEVDVETFTSKKVDLTEQAKEEEIAIAKTEPFYYNIKAAFTDEDIESASITDELEPVLDYIGAKLVDEDGNDVTEELGILTYDSVTNTVNYVFKDSEFSKLLGNRYWLVMNVTFKAKADLSEYAFSRVPNKAQFEFNGDGHFTNEVFVKPIIEKKVDFVEDAKQELITIARDKEYYYNIPVNIPNEEVTSAEIVDELEPVLEYVSAKVLDMDGNDVTTLGTVVYDDVTNTVRFVFSSASYPTIQNQYYNLVIVAKIKEDADLSGYVNGVIPNDANLEFNNESYVSNEVNVETLTSKSVSELDGALLQELTIARNAEYKYEVEINIPDELVLNASLSDKLDSALEFSSAKLIDTDGNDVTADFGSLKFDDSTNTVSYVFSPLSYGDIQGNYYKLIIVAKIKEDADLSGYINETIPNKANFSFNLEDNPTNTVNVKPITSKTVDVVENALKQDIIVAREKEYYYNVSINVPNETVTSASISDQLESVLKYESAKLVDDSGNDVTSLGELTYDELSNTVRFVFSDTSYGEIQGKHYKLLIVAKIKEDADLSEYIKNQIPNQADFEFNAKNNPTNVVTVKPTDVYKTVDKTEDALKHELTVARNEEYYYNVEINVPTGTITSASLSDELEPVLEYVSAKLLDEDGNDVTSKLGKLTFSENKNTVKYVFNADSYKEISGNTYKLVMVAKIRSDVDLTGYVHSEVPNVAVFNLNGENKPSNEVIVKSTIEKTVDTSEEALKTAIEVEKSTEYYYNVAINMPNEEITSAVISDKLEPVLGYKSAKVVDEAGNDVTNKLGTLVYDKSTNSVRYVFNEESYKEIQGKRYVLVIVSQVKEGADLSGYANREIPNKATLEINGSHLSSNIVTTTVKTPLPVTGLVSSFIGLLLLVVLFGLRIVKNKFKLG